MHEQASAERRSWRDGCILLIAEGLGLGRVQFMPGTVGSLWGLPIGWLLGACNTIWWERLLIGVVMFVAGIPICGRAAAIRRRKDPRSVVWDEIAAFPVVYAFVPIRWHTLLIGFVLFRVFDIVKPPPIRHVERLGGGLGIMIDDTVAAVWALVPLLILVHGTSFSS